MRLLSVKVFAGIVVVIVLLIITASVFFRNSPIQQNTPADQATVTLSPKKENLLPNTGISLTLEQVTIPKKECRDCITYAKIIAKKAGQTKTLEYKIGGIAGLMVNTQKAFSYTFSLKSIDTGQVTIRYLLEEKP